MAENEIAATEPAAPENPLRVLGAAIAGAVSGAVSGSLAGGVVSTAIMFIKIKLGW